MCFLVVPDAVQFENAEIILHIAPMAGIHRRLSSSPQRNEFH